ncbi:Tetrathionate reductase subunit B precursor [Bremerella volcania]|uniref:Tetrathionate reductase subunit B n=1 Tax=Bremerella volcania TaxID=2527984 RepID=A0A518CBW8_9BACT|nr:TAT-variant-translocated molybdopterin oxidoreductase [Bremerella volcania]QDU76722.1 Tetrathionate reductase subunit B precursor [Bremerella volcania]
MPENKKPKYWRSLGELEGTPEFEQFLRQEFPEAAEVAPTGMPRRRWMQLMGASLALATGAAGCRYPEEEVVGFRYPEEEIAPFSRRPEGRIPGKPEKFATTLTVAGKTCPVVATSYDGRPIKIDGNQMHPMVAGADTYSQATLLHLYDPDRSQYPIERDVNGQHSRSWDEFAVWWKEQSKKLEGGNSSKLAILHQTNTSPTVLAQMNEVAKKFPQAKWYQYESITGNTTLGTELAFGKKLRPLLNLEAADIVVDLSADVLGSHVTHGVNNQGFAKRRAPEDGPMSRLYVVESRFSVTGIAADHRLAVAASLMPSFVADLEQKLEAALESGETKEKPAEKIDIVITAMVNDLISHKGKSLVVGGESLDAETQARIWRINSKLENLGKTVSFIEEPKLARDNVGSIEDLTAAMNAGQVDTVLFLGGNPVYDAPADVDLVAAMDKTNTQVYYGDYETETSKMSSWHLPASHGLEQWGDALAYDGSFCIAQPLISPIFKTKNPIEFLSLIAGSPISETLEAVKQTVTTAFSSSASEAAWTKVLHDGFIADSAPKAVSVTINDSLDLGNVSVSTWRAGLGEAYDLIFHPGAGTYDGRFANNGWLQELPEPITKVTWDNVVTMSPKTAEENGVQQAELVELSANGKTVTLPVYIQPGQAHGTLAVGLGYGRTHAGAVGGNVDEDIAPVGVDVGPLRTKETMNLATGATFKGTGKQFKLATTQDHFAIDLLGMREIGRRVGELVREGTVEEYEHHPDFAKHIVHHPPLESLWEEQEWMKESYDGHAWGMSIDLTKCTGCNACTIACQSENNIPIVGKEAVSVGREMHWIRVDRYFSGDMEDPKAVSQPVTCQQCETAPCESVCPVAATVHSDEGLNDMVYNRCIGTRYCGNNCPYKVRRFNYLDWRASDHRFEAGNQELAKLIFNPEVTVRNRGVMEKCTYCVQRIQNTKIEAKADRRAIGPNEIQVACQEACASNAIEFGDLNNPESNVAKAHANPRSYSMLVELNTKPRTRYLARITNPHPWLAPEVTDHGEHGHDDESDHGHEHAEGDHDHDHAKEEEKH